LNHEGHEEHEATAVRLGCRKAACRDVRKRKYKPHWRCERFVSAFPHVTAVGALRAPTNRTP